MITVFGIQFPLFEILLVFLVFLTAGLIFIFLELKKLNSFIREEQSDVTRFERDIQSLEQEEGKLNQEERIIENTVLQARRPPTQQRNQNPAFQQNNQNNR